MTNEPIKYVVWKRSVPSILDTEDKYECIRCGAVVDDDHVVYRDSTWENGWECKGCLLEDHGEDARWLTPRAAVEAFE